MTEDWTSRKRVAAALDHREPDRVPLSMTITEVPYRGLRKFLDFPPDQNLKPNRFGEVSPAYDLLEFLGFDTVSIKLSPPRVGITPPSQPDGVHYDEWGVGRKRIDLGGGAFLLEVCHAPLEDKHPQEIDLAQYPWPDPSDPGRTSDLEERSRTIYQETDLAIIGRFGGTILEQASFLRGFETWLMDLVLYPDFARELLERIADIQIEMDRRGIQAAGKYLSIFKASGDDLGMQDRPLFSPLVWDQILRPVLARRWKAARQALDQSGASHVKLMFHSDGAIRPFLPDMIADGIQVLDPVQTSAKGMEICGLKEDFGPSLVFHGGLDTQRLLPFGSPEEVKTETIRTLRVLGAGGGLILGPSHNVQPDVPPENLQAMCQAVQEAGHYPL